MDILQDFIRRSFETHWEWMERYVDGLSQAEIEFRPDDQSHSIGFILWHYGRALDMWVQSLAKQESQLYETGWAQRLGFQPEPMNVGFGYTVEDLANWKCPEKSLLLEYANDSRNNLLGFLSIHDDGSLAETTMTNRRGETIAIGDMFRMLIWEVNQHGGQAGYLRGMQRGLNQ
jgi:hypothetical protein